MSAKIQTITSVEPHGENLSIVTTSGGNKVIANRKADGLFRWEAGEPVCYVSEGSILPEDVLKTRGYWDVEKNRGLLDGGPRNRVKMKKLAGFESRGLLFKVGLINMGNEITGLFMARYTENSEEPDSPIMTNRLDVNEGDDVSEFLGITEFQG